MARRARTQIDDLLDGWALWCSTGGLGGGGASMLARMIDSHGHLTFGAGGSSGGPLDAMEARIEALVLMLSARDQLAADVLRFEYNAGEQRVTRRRDIRDYSAQGVGQVEKAAALRVSLRTYRRRLALARETITTGLAKTANTAD